MADYFPGRGLPPGIAGYEAGRAANNRETAQTFEMLVNAARIKEAQRRTQLEEEGQRATAAYRKEDLAARAAAEAAREKRAGEAARQRTDIALSAEQSRRESRAQAAAQEQARIEREIRRETATSEWRMRQALTAADKEAEQIRHNQAMEQLEGERIAAIKAKNNSSAENKGWHQLQNGQWINDTTLDRRFRREMNLPDELTIKITEDQNPKRAAEMRKRVEEASATFEKWAWEKYRIRVTGRIDEPAPAPAPAAAPAPGGKPPVSFRDLR